MMSCIGPEYKTLEQCYPTLVSCIQHSPNDIADQLRPFGILASRDITFLSNVYIDDSTKAERIVDVVMNQVQGDPGVFHKFIAALKAAGDWTQTVTIKLQDEFASISHKTEKSIRAALSDEPTLEELCTLPVEKAWYQLGLWLGVDESELQEIEKTEYPLPEKMGSLLGRVCYRKVSAEELSFLRVNRMFKSFLRSESIKYRTFIEKLPFKCRETLTKFLIYKDQAFAQESEKIIEDVQNQELKSTGKEFIQNKISRHNRVVTALVKVGLRQTADKMCNLRGKWLKHSSSQLSLGICAILYLGNVASGNWYHILFQE